MATRTSKRTTGETATAKAVYEKRWVATKALLARVQAELDAHGEAVAAQPFPNWAAVGDLGALAGKLAEWVGSMHGLEGAEILREIGWETI